MNEKEREVAVSKGMLAFVGSLNAMRLTVSTSTLELVKSWLDFYYRWEGRRVVGHDEPELVAIKLLADSFAYQKVEIVKDSASVVDLGSGNGWPGMALGFENPGCTMSLLDSRKGACDFMKQFLLETGVPGFQVIEARVEELAQDSQMAERFDVAVSRAMARPSIVLELASPLVKLKGQVLLWLSQEQGELAAKTPSLNEIGFLLTRVLRYHLPYGHGTRSLAVYHKFRTIRPGSRRQYANIKRKPLF